MALTKVVGSLEPFQRTVAAAEKFEPLTLRVKVGPPAWAVEGERLVMERAGAAVIVKVESPDVTPLALTVTVAVPWAAMRLATTDAFN